MSKKKIKSVYVLKEDLDHFLKTAVTPTMYSEEELYTDDYVKHDDVFVRLVPVSTIRVNKQTKVTLEKIAQEKEMVWLL